MAGYSEPGWACFGTVAFLFGGAVAVTVAALFVVLPASALGVWLRGRLQVPEETRTAFG